MRARSCYLNSYILRVARTGEPQVRWAAEVTVRLLALITLLVLVACDEQTFPPERPALPHPSITFEPDVERAWEDARIKPPTVLHRPTLEFDPSYPGGHLPVAKGTSIVFVISVATDGSVSSVAVPDWAGLTSEQLRADIVENLKSWRFVPAKDELGNVVPGETKITIRFNL
jgi:hypothetical protein